MRRAGYRSGIASVDLESGNIVEVWVGTTKLGTVSLGAGGGTSVGYNVDNVLSASSTRLAATQAATRSSRLCA